MPLLSAECVQDLLDYAYASSSVSRGSCSNARDYCRTCDEFYFLHDPDCEEYVSKHHGHRLTIIPFVEER